MILPPCKNVIIPRHTMSSALQTAWNKFIHDHPYTSFKMIYSWFKCTAYDFSACEIKTTETKGLIWWVWWHREVAWNHVTRAENFTDDAKHYSFIHVTFQSLWLTSFPSLSAGLSHSNSEDVATKSNTMLPRVKLRFLRVWTLLQTLQM